MPYPICFNSCCCTSLKKLTGYIFLCVDNIDLRRRIVEENKNNIFIKGILDCISPLKDVDGLTDVNMGKLAKFEYGGIRPCTPKGIIDLLQCDDIDLTGKEVVIVGRSNIVGSAFKNLL